MFLLLPARMGCPGQSPESRKMIVVVVVVVSPCVPSVLWAAGRASNL